MRVAVDDLLSERTAVHEIVCSYDFLTPWAFERTPASSEDLEQSYLRPVEECDIFILVIGAQVTDPVIEESLPSVVGSKAANGGQVKTGQRK
jgi:Domain of unknown function (DUF4062)